MKHCCVEDPTDLCSVNISGQNLSEAKEQDFRLFDNVAYINAAENILPLSKCSFIRCLKNNPLNLFFSGCFSSFPILRELEVPLNGLRNIKISVGEFQHLEARFAYAIVSTCGGSMVLFLSAS
jgi:hypothetical protein